MDHGFGRRWCLRALYFGVCTAGAIGPGSLAGCSSSGELDDGGPAAESEASSSEATRAADAASDTAQGAPTVGDGASDATIDAPEGASGGGDGAADATVDAAATPDAVSDAPAESGATCLGSDSGIGGMAIPVGTTVTDSGSYNPSGSVSTQTPLLAGVGWNAGAYTGWIELTFPAPLSLTGIQLIAGAEPATGETYTVTGFQGSTSISLGTWTEMDQNGVTILPPMLFQPGVYSGIEVAVNGGSSWVAINDLSLITADCPGPGDAGSPEEAGVADATSGPPDATVPQDSGESDALPSDATADACVTNDDPPAFAPPCGLDDVELTSFLSCSGSMAEVCNGVDTAILPPATSWIQWRASAMPLADNYKAIVDSVDPALSQYVDVEFMNQGQGALGGFTEAFDDGSEYSINDTNGMGAAVFQVNIVGNGLTVKFVESFDTNEGLVLPCPEGGAATAHSAIVDVTCTSTSTVPTSSLDGGDDGAP